MTNTEFRRIQKDARFADKTWNASYLLGTSVGQFCSHFRGIKAGLNADCKFIYGRQYLKEMDECLTEVTSFFRTKFDVYLEVENETRYSSKLLIFTCQMFISRFIRIPQIMLQPVYAHNFIFLLMLIFVVFPSFGLLPSFVSVILSPAIPN